VNPSSESTTDPYIVEQVRSYCQLEVETESADVQWDQLENATQATIEAIRAAGRTQILVDLSHLTTIESGTVASLVRIWKSLHRKTRRFVVVSPHDRVRSELESAGLHKLWTIVADREEAAYQLGVSRRAERELRELRILALGAFPCAVLAALALLLVFLGNQINQLNIHLTALLLGVMSLTVGIVSVLKDTGFRRVLSALAVVISLLVLSTLFFERSPVRFRISSEPSLEIESE
jgi:anti-anti-sigma factor